MDFLDLGKVLHVLMNIFKYADTYTTTLQRLMQTQVKGTSYKFIPSRQNFETWAEFCS